MLMGFVKFSLRLVYMSNCVGQICIRLVCFSAYNYFSFYENGLALFKIGLRVNEWQMSGKKYKANLINLWALISSFFLSARSFQSTKKKCSSTKIPQLTKRCVNSLPNMNQKPSQTQISSIGLPPFCKKNRWGVTTSTHRQLGF